MYDVSPLHHLKPSAGDGYAFQPSSLLPYGGKLMVRMLSEDEPRFGKNHEFMNPVTDTTTYLPAKEELRGCSSRVSSSASLKKSPLTTTFATSA